MKTIRWNSQQQNFTRFDIGGIPSTILGKFATLNFPSLPAMSTVFNLSRLSGLCDFILRVSFTDKVFGLNSVPSTMLDLKKYKNHDNKREPLKYSSLKVSAQSIKKKTKFWITFKWMKVFTYFFLKHLLKNSITFCNSFEIISVIRKFGDIIHNEI